MSYQRLSLKLNQRQANINRFSYLLKDPKKGLSQEGNNQKKSSFSLFQCFKDNRCRQTNIEEFHKQKSSHQQNKHNFSDFNNSNKKSSINKQFDQKSLFLEKLIKKNEHLDSFQTPKKEQYQKNRGLSTYYQSKQFSITSQPNFLQKTQPKQSLYNQKSQFFQFNKEFDQLFISEQQNPFTKSKINQIKTYLKNQNSLQEIYSGQEKKMLKNQLGIKTPIKQKLKIVTQLQNPFQINKKEKYVIAKSQRIKTHQMSSKLQQSKLKQQSLQTKNCMTPKSIKLKGKSKSKQIKRLF